MSELLSVLDNYDLFSRINTIEKINVGNINTTYKVICADGQKYILQRINNCVFHDVEALMKNIVNVTNKLRNLKMQKSLDKMQVLNIKFTRDGMAYVQNDGKFYRLYDFMPAAKTYSNTDDLNVVFKAGEAFGVFARLVNTGDDLILSNTIEGFHNTKKYLSKLDDSYKKATKSRKNRAEELYYSIKSNAIFASRIQARLDRLPSRIVHNDTKISNVAFDEKTNDALGILDLDTVMNGRIAYDFGDGARSIAGPVREDVVCPTEVNFDLDKFEAFANGYLRVMSNVLRYDEKKQLPNAIFLITLELSARFLTDFLDGDCYFNVSYSMQNLHRAKCQFLLATDIKHKHRKIIKIVNNACKTGLNV